jgi:outer membrane lipase/esterase
MLQRAPDSRARLWPRRMTPAPDCQHSRAASDRCLGIRRALTLLAFGCSLLLAADPASAQSAPTVALAFAPSTMASGATSQMTIAFGNANAAVALLLQPMNDGFPAGLTLANGSVGGSCNAKFVTAKAGAGAVSYGRGGPIPSGGCTIVVQVTATSKSASTAYTNTIPAGAVQTDFGGNAAAASATLTVRSVIAVPNLVGQSQAGAATLLQARGLVLGAVSHSPGPAPYNAVFQQAPASGTIVQSGSPVAVTISTGAGTAGNPQNPLTSTPGLVDPSQQTVAGAIERVCAALNAAGGGNSPTRRNLFANCTAIIGTYGGGAGSASGLKNTLDAVSGKQTTAQQQTGVQFAGAQFTNIGTRLAQLRQGAAGASFAGLDVGLPGGLGLDQLLAALDSPAASHGLAQGAPFGGGASADGDKTGSPWSRVGVFVNGSLRRGSQATTDLETGFDFKNNGVTAGIDYRFTDRLVLGVALGHSSGTTDFAEQSARLDSNSTSGSLYGTYFSDALYVDFIGTFGRIKYDDARTTMFTIAPGGYANPTNCVGPTCTIDVNGSTSARQFAFGSNLGYSFHQNAFVFGPDVSLDYTRVNVNGFSESDPSQTGMALVYGDQVGESLILKAGGHLSLAISTPIGVILPQVRARYNHEFKNDQRGLLVHFAADPTIGTPTGTVSNFVVFTDRPDRSYFDWAAGVTAQLTHGIAAFVDYNALAGLSNVRTHELAFGVRFEILMP